MDLSLQRSPVYQQLNQRLRKALATDFKKGDRFLTEREISDAFGVSRATANKVLSGLVSEGVLEFRHGVGTFVRRAVIDYDVRSLISFTEKARAAGKTPSTTVLDFGCTTAAEADAKAAEALGVAGETRLWKMERLRLADNEPVILESRFVVYSLCPDLKESEVARSLYECWSSTHKLQIGGADEVIHAVALKKSEATLLETAIRTPALEIKATGFLTDGKPLWWERTLYRGDRYEFHSRLGPIQSATPARGKLSGP